LNRLETTLIMKHFLFFTGILFLSIGTNAQVHTTYLWHLHQPIYWSGQSTWNNNRYQTVWESEYLKNNGGNIYSGTAHPLNNLSDIFSNADRVAAYQYRTKDAVSSLSGHSEGGAQVCYSGALIENVNSLASAGQWGYGSGWQNNYVTARGWTTANGKPRMDIVGFTSHHILSPLASDRVLKKDIEVHKYLYGQTFGTSPLYSKGYWPAECSFSERNIKALVEEGFEWSVIANSHLARTLNDYPLTFGTSGCNYDPPNKADKVAANGTNWWNGQIDGRGGTYAAPYCYQAHKAKYVDPATGKEYKITVVPMCDLLSYQNGYSTMGTGDIDAHIAPFNSPSQPSIVLLAHDGDNAWGGGFDYYNNSVPGFAGAAASQGYVPTTIEQFLYNHPVPVNDVVHVEDGSWVNAANDWGHPQFINWFWPMYTAQYDFDPNGWTEDARNWAVLIAAENRVEMAEDLAGALTIANIASPTAASSLAEKAWHFLLPGFASDYMYYGTSLDMEVKQTLAANLAVGYADQVISANPGTDNTPPTVMVPQRYPYNPGGIGFGPNYGYQQHNNTSDFYVWTFAYDVSGIQSAVLKYRVDYDGQNPESNNDNDTYAGGSGVGSWNNVNMTLRNFPTGNITSNPEIDFFILPTYIAGEYYAQIAGLHDTLVDYYIEVTDNNNKIAKTAIQHVYIGNSNTGGSGGNGNVHWLPANPTLNDTITITVTNATQAGKLHWGVNNTGSNWIQPNNVYWPTGTVLFNGTGPSVETPMAGPVSNTLTLSIGPFNNPSQVVTQVALVIHFANNTWDNNNGQDFHIPINNNPTNVADVSQNRYVSIYPNPFGDYCYINLSGNEWHSYNVEIYDIRGNKVRSLVMQKNVQKVERDFLKAGLYIVKVTDMVTGEVFSDRVMVM